MPHKEAQARIKINKLLESSGWRFFDDASGSANIVLEPNIKLTRPQVDAMDMTLTPTFSLETQRVIVVEIEAE